MIRQSFAHLSSQSPLIILIQQLSKNMLSPGAAKQTPLCKLSFDIDDSHHELPLFANSSLHRIVDELAQTLDIQSMQERQFLKEEVSARIHSVLEENHNASPEWQSKLAKILKESPQKKITYFGYGRDGDSSYARIKRIHQQLASQGHESSKTTSRLKNQQRLHTEMQARKRCQTHARQETTKDQLSQCTFHPIIRAQRSSSKVVPFGSVFQRLYDQAEDKNAKRKRIEKQIIQREKQQISQLSFIPNINKCSRQIVRTKNQIFHTEMPEQLNSITSTTGRIIHQNSSAKQNKRQQKQTLFFKEVKNEKTPNSKDKSPAVKSKFLQQKSINQPTQRKPTKNAKSQRVSTCTSEPVLEKTFLKRIKPSTIKKQKENNHYWLDESHLKKQKYVIEETYATEEEEVKIKPKSMNRPKGTIKNPFEFFQIQEETLKNKQAVSQSHLTQTEKEPQLSVNFQERKNIVFETIFRALARNSDQVSSVDIIESKFIPENIRHIFLPMAEEMQSLGVGLDQEEFTWSVCRIFDTLSLPDRGYLLAWGMGLPASIR